MAGYSRASLQSNLLQIPEGWTPQLVVQGREGQRGKYYFHSCWTYACEILWNTHGLSAFIFSHTVTELTRWGGVVLSTA